MTRILIVAAGVLFVSSMASAQLPTQDLPDAANPTATPPVSNDESTQTDRPPAAAVPDANAPGPAISGQAPAASEKMHPEMGGVGGDRPFPGAEKK
jgi:hypothetical protein